MIFASVFVLVVPNVTGDGKVSDRMAIFSEARLWCWERK